MIQSNKKYIHWDYYLAIEDDLKNLARYIDFSDSNYLTYSIELARILQITCSEIDVVSKLLCEKIDSSKKYIDINDYKKQLSNSIPSIITEKVYSKRYWLELNPFINWNNNINPDWWSSYNLVKHKRNINFHEANLKNVLNAVAGLLIIIVNYYLKDFSSNNNIKDLFHDISNNSKESEFFTLEDSYYYHRLVV